MLPPDKKPEIHKKYADVQFVAKGREMLGFAPDIGDLTITDGRKKEIFTSMTMWETRAFHSNQRLL